MMKMRKTTVMMMMMMILTVMNLVVMKRMRMRMVMMMRLLIHRKTKRFRSSGLINVVQSEQKVDVIQDYECGSGILSN